MSFLLPSTPSYPITPATITYTAASQSGSDLTTYTFSSLSIGTADSARTVIVLINGSDVSRTVSSCTVGGNSASLTAGTNIGNNQNFNEIWEVDLASGTSGDVVVVWSGAQDNCSVIIYSALNIGPISDVAYDTADTGNVMSADLDVTVNGIAIGFCSNNDSSVTFTWSGLTENVDATTEGARSYTGASAAISAAETGKTITATMSGTANDEVLVLAAWPVG
jgi:hypothetical protein